jgi:hypothetical protein
MMGPYGILLIAGSVFLAVGVGLGVLDWRRSRRQAVMREQTGADAAAWSDGDRRAAQAAVADAHDANRAWNDAHRSYDARAYVLAGLARSLARASAARGDALRNAAAAGLHPRAQLIPDDWRPPEELHDDPAGRPIPERWARFDRATNTLAAVGSTTDSTLDEVAAAHDELAAAAIELAEQLEAVAPAAKNAPSCCSFCGHTVDQVTTLIAGPGVSICDECVDLCNEITTREP